MIQFSAEWPSLYTNLGAIMYGFSVMQVMTDETRDHHAEQCRG